MGVYLSYAYQHAHIYGLSFSEREMLGVFAEYADDYTSEGYHSKLQRQLIVGSHSYPSLRKIANEMGVSRTTLHAATASLIDKGWVRKGHKKKRKSGRTPEQYDVNISMLCRVYDVKKTCDVFDIEAGTDLSLIHI